MNIKEKLQQYSNLVTTRPSKDGRFLVVKYKREVFFKDLWDDFLRECRGMVLDLNYDIVSLPFTKIHNYGVEKDAPGFSDHELVLACRKVNGFMIAATWHDGDILWSTTGSVDSEYIGYAKDMFDRMSDRSKHQFKQCLSTWSYATFLFECVHPMDPHIVDEEPGLYLLATRAKALDARVIPWSTDTIADDVKVPENKIIRFSELKEELVNCKHEGFVFYSLGDARASKIKSKHYLTKKALMRKNFDKIKTLDKSMVDEEFYPLIDWFKEFDDDRRTFFEVFDEQARREYLENWLSKK